MYPNKDNVIIDIDTASDPSETKMPAFLRPLARKETHFPVKSLNLAIDEYPFVLVGKIRPAIILIEDTVQWAKSPSENLALCVPIFRVAKAKFSQVFVLKTQAFQFPNKFYIPSYQGDRLEEGIARLELIQTVNRLVMSPFPDSNNPIMLTEEFFTLLRIHITRFLGGILSKEDQDTLDVYSQLILEESRKQGINI